MYPTKCINLAYVNKKRIKEIKRTCKNSYKFFLDNVKGETDYVIICNSKIILRMVLFYFIILAKKTPSIRNSQQVWVSGSSSKHAILFDLANT